MIQSIKSPRGLTTLILAAVCALAAPSARAEKLIEWTNLRPQTKPLVDPFNLLTPKKSGEGFRPDFEMGAFVEVRIQGRPMAGVIPIPTEALRIGNKVWVAGVDDKLHIRQVETARISKREALVTSGLKAGDRVIITPLGGVVEGMKLRLHQGRNSKVKEQAPPLSDKEQPKRAAEPKKQARLTESAK